MTSTDNIATIRVLGSCVHMVDMTQVLENVEGWVKNPGGNRYIVATGMHGVMEALRHPDVKDALNSADLFVADGISLVWVSRLRGHTMKSRVCGSDLMWECLKQGEAKGYRHFFYGDTEETLEQLALSLTKEFPNLKIAGYRSPPFRTLTPAEQDYELQLINASGADMLWVGLGMPKQERWMFKNRQQLNVPVAVGVGAAFKFLSGQVSRAPSWMGDLGFEWLWRFFHEPRRVWRRVFIDMPIFAYHVAMEQIGLKHYN